MICLLDDWVNDSPDDTPTWLLDTTVLIGLEAGRIQGRPASSVHLVTSVVTAAELEWGIHMAADTETRLTRLITYQSAMRMQLLIIDRQVSHQYAALRASVARAKRRVNVNNMLIAAIALANQIPVLTQDDDFDALAEVSKLDVIHI